VCGRRNFGTVQKFVVSLANVEKDLWTRPLAVRVKRKYSEWIDTVHYTRVLQQRHIACDVDMTLFSKSVTLKHILCVQFYSWGFAPHLLFPYSGGLRGTRTPQESSLTEESSWVPASLLFVRSGVRTCLCSFLSCFCNEACMLIVCVGLAT
jgi:hypothetical protein